MSPIEIRVRQVNPLRQALLLVIVFAAVYFILGYMPTVLWIAAAVLAVALPYRLIRGYSTDPVVILNDDGVFDRRLKVGVIRWSDIRRIKPYSFSGVEYISLDLHDHKQYQSRRPLWLKLLSQPQRLIGMSSIAIMTSDLDIEPKTLARMIHEGCGSRDVDPFMMEME